MKRHRERMIAWARLNADAKAGCVRMGSHLVRTRLLGNDRGCGRQHACLNAYPGRTLDCKLSLSMVDWTGVRLGAIASPVRQDAAQGSPGLR
jgi:hypothetical protein